MNAMDSPARSYGGDCSPAGFNISSYGFLENKESPFVILGYSLPLLELQIILIFFFVFFSHMFLRSIGIPQFVSFMIAGLILGPHLFDLIELSSRGLSTYDVFQGTTTLDCVGEFGFTMFTFLMAVKTNWRLAFRNGKTPFVIAFSSVFVPLFVCMAFKNFFPNMIGSLYMPLDKGLVERRTLVSLQSLTLLPVVTHLLSELKILGSQLGRVAISAAVIADFSGIVLLIVVATAGTYTEVSPVAAYAGLAMTAALFLAAAFVVKPLAQRIVEVTPQGKPVRKIYLYVLVMAALGSSTLTSWKQKNVMGPLLFGLAIPDGPPLGSAMETKFEKLTETVLLPIFIATSTMRGDVARLVHDFDNVLYNMFLVVLTLIVKWVASFLPCLYYKIPLRDSAALAFIMCYRGFTELYLYGVARNRSAISQATHTFIILYVLLSGGIVPTVVKSLYDPRKKYVGYDKRSIMSSRDNSDLRILLCLHKPDNISSMIAFLRTLASSKQRSPLFAVTVLHLVKLVGRAFPDLISHDKNSNRVIQSSYIKTATLAFNEFGSENRESFSISMFTSITKVDLMHEDINTLALDHLSSMIVVPSGRKWSVDGSFESDDIEIRRLNAYLVEHAPCSVGILVDRGYFTRISNLRSKKRFNVVRVGMVFIGGKDDREALSVATLMKPNPRVHLTVFRIIFSEKTEFTNWEYILDHEALKDLKQRQGDDVGDSVAYAEKTVKNGPETVSL